MCHDSDPVQYPNVHVEQQHVFEAFIFFCNAQLHPQQAMKADYEACISQHFAKGSISQALYRPFLLLAEQDAIPVLLFPERELTRLFRFSIVSSPGTLPRACLTNAV